MRVGWIGLGKLGFPIAVTVSARVAPVVGTDLRWADVAGCLTSQTWPHVELGLDRELAYHRLNVVGSIADVVTQSDVVFVAVETPHGPEHEGVTRLPATKADFDYTALKAVVREVAKVGRPVTLAIVSTVLPGTMRREVLPLLDGTGIKLVYTPSFVAMGRVAPDLLAPEFVLMGAASNEDAALVHEVWARLLTAGNVTMFRVRLEEAELVKVAYNGVIGAKICFANTLLQICEQTNANVDVVSTILAQARARLWSGAYLRGGLGDGGACHPRDGIALSWLADDLQLGHDFFGSLMQVREAQTEWVAEIVEALAEQRKPILVYGRAYKPGTKLDTGSIAKLLHAILRERAPERQQVLCLDPALDGEVTIPMNAVVVIGTPYPELQKTKFPRGTLIVDPWGIVPDAPGIVVHRLGRRVAA